MKVDILILSNGPGEITTWVRPVVKALREKLADERSQLRISVVLSPCPNATGKEVAIASSYPEVDRVQSSEYFFPFLLWGKTKDAWDWREKGIVIFLGGDQFFPVVIGQRLRYRTVVYAEWDARWYRKIDRFALLNSSVIAKVPSKYHHKLTVVGDLMADLPLSVIKQGRRQEAGGIPSSNPQTSTIIGLMPGSKAAKLAQGVPLCLAIAQEIQQKQPDIHFVIPVAPTLDLVTLAQFADPNKNPVLNKVGGVSAKLILPHSDTLEPPCLQTTEGLRIELATQFPYYDLLSQCRLVLTTVGANTAELTSLAIPMIVLLPTQQLDAMRAWDGIPGILANLPFLGSLFAKIINKLILKQGRLFAWPNIWAKEEIVPELLGELQAAEVGEIVVDFLANPEKLEQMGDRLRKIRGQSGAAYRIAEIVIDLFDKLDENECLNDLIG